MDAELFEKISNAYSECRDGIRSVCKRHKSTWEAYRDYRDKTPGAPPRYARAVIDKYEKLLDELYMLEDKALRAVESCDPKSSGAVATIYRTKIDNLKWTLSKIKPEKYGDKVDLTSGGDKLPSSPPVINVCSQEAADIVNRFVRQEPPVVTSTTQG